jgi:REP element-mobilizing transposase RayT
MSRNYKFHNSEGLYFISFAVVGWLDVFIRNEYKEILLESLRFCQKSKGMEIHAWCIMSSHVHLVFRSINGQKPEALIGVFKKIYKQSNCDSNQGKSYRKQKRVFIRFLP